MAAWVTVLAPTSPAPPTFAAVRDAWRTSYAIVRDRDGAILQRSRLDMRELRGDWLPLADVAPVVIDTLLAVEDRRFYDHGGVDVRALLGAAWQNLRGGHRGASTLTMQLANLLEGRHSGARRGLRAKWAQMLAARALEAQWSKAEILEAYVNEVGLRGELRGVDAGARALFGKQAAMIDATEAVVFATLVSSPNLPPARLGQRACRLAQAHRIATECSSIVAAADTALNTPSAPIADADADRAPHLARRLVHAAGDDVTSTVNGRLQRMVQAVLDEQLRELEARNVRDAAAVVVDNASGDVLAYVGAAGQHSRAPAVDGVAAHRQAGSTLKPFLYGLAFEQRYLTPASLLEDTPLNLETASGLYLPQNYDHQFKGMVSARTALASSLNVPAVRTAMVVGVDALRARLFDFGYADIREDGTWYGYALALGAAEVSLLEQANAYRALANGGQWSPLRYTVGEQRGAPRAVLSPGAAFLVGDVLADSAARAPTFGLDSPLATPFWSAVKTGTSKDMRDNWCVGYSARYTVAVWVGNFEGDAMHDVSGVSGAAPAWLAIMRGLHASTPSTAPAAPAGVVANAIEFVPPLEPPRREWFIAGTEQARVELIDGAAQAPRIVEPPDGMVVALDPDIPQGRQQLRIAARGVASDARFYLDDVLVGAADEVHTWTPRPGRHRLELRGGTRVMDRIAFTVRTPH